MDKCPNCGYEEFVPPWPKRTQAEWDEMKENEPIRYVMIKNAERVLRKNITSDNALKRFLDG